VESVSVLPVPCRKWGPDCFDNPVKTLESTAPRLPDFPFCAGASRDELKGSSPLSTIVASVAPASAALSVFSNPTYHNNKL
jgi:hypothetical protein